MEFKSIEINTAAPTNEEWRAAVAENAKNAVTFEIHCWNEEKAETALALKYGILKETGWKYGRVISGPVTGPFMDFLLSFPKPADTEVYNKMTPFFSIFFDNGFSSEHYGTELNQIQRPD